jgi:hypothetical protein
VAGKCRRAGTHVRNHNPNQIARTDDPTLTVGSDSTRLLDNGPIGSLESGNTTGGELGEVVVPLSGLHVDHDELDVATSEDGGGTGTGDTPVVCGGKRHRGSCSCQRHGLVEWLMTPSRRTHWGKSRSFRGKTFLWLFLGCQRWNTVGMSERLSIAMFNTGYSRLTMREKESESKRESDVVTLGNAMIDIYLCAFSRIPPRCSLAPQTNPRARKQSISALLSGAHRMMCLHHVISFSRVSGNGFRTSSLNHRVVVVVAASIPIIEKRSFALGFPDSRLGCSSIPRGFPNEYFANQPLLGMTLSARLKLASKIDD